MLPAAIPETSLPALVERAANTLASAKTAAEVLTAAEMASIAYDAAKRAARLAKAKGAYSELMGKVTRAQADALDIEAQAKRRIADEYDAAQERGEIRTQADNQAFSKEEKASGPSIMPPKELHEARQIRDAERNDPGIVRRTLDKAIEAGEEPTRAKVKRAVKAKSKRTRRPKGHQHKVEESQHDRDLRMLMGVWSAACESARAEFLETVMQ